MLRHFFQWKWGIFWLLSLNSHPYPPKSPGMLYTIIFEILNRSWISKFHLQKMTLQILIMLQPLKKASVWTFYYKLSAWKKSAQFIHSFYVMEHILDSQDLKVTTTTFEHAHPIIISYPEFVSPFKISVYPTDSFMRWTNLKVLWSGYPHRFLTTSNPLFFINS